MLGSRSSGSTGQGQLGRGWSPRLRSGASALQALGRSDEIGQSIQGGLLLPLLLLWAAPVLPPRPEELSEPLPRGPEKEAMAWGLSCS